MVLEGQQAVHKENGTQFPKLSFLRNQESELRSSTHVKGIGSRWESGFLIERSFCCITASSPCSCRVLTADWENCLKPVVCSIKQCKEERGSLVSSGMIENKVVTPCFCYISLSDGSSLPLLILIEMQPGRSQQGLN